MYIHPSIPTPSTSYAYIIYMSTLNLELGFNVPRQLIYEALIHPQ